jgi:hypothetical protein
MGDLDASPASEVVLGGGAGVPKVLQLADRQSEESVASLPGLDSDGSRQSGFDSTAVSETSDPGEKGTVVGNEFSLALSAEGVGLLVTPQVRTSQLCVGMGSSGFGVDPVSQRQGVGSLEMVMFSAIEGEVGIVSEAILGGPPMENCLWKGLGDKMESGASVECVVAEKCAHFDCSSKLLEHFHEGLLLQDKTRDGEGELESYEPLVIAPLVVEDADRQRVSPRWVVERIKRFYPIIGLSCGHFEDILLALFEEIEVARDLSLADSKTKIMPALGVKGKRELNRLTWSVNYEKKGVRSDRGRHKGRGTSRYYDA